MSKTIVTKIADNKKFDAPLYALSLLFFVGGFFIDWLIPAWRYGNPFPPMIGVIAGIVLFLMIREAKNVRYWKTMALEIAAGKNNSLALKSWQNIYYAVFTIIMGIFPYISHQNGIHDNHPQIITALTYWTAWIFIVGGIWFLLVRTRWSPISIPEIEVTKDYIRAPNPFSIYVDGHPVRKRSYLTGVVLIKITRLTKIYWQSLGYSPTLVINCSGVDVEHPFLRKPTETIIGNSFVVSINLSGGTVSADAIVGFVENIASKTIET